HRTGIRRDLSGAGRVDGKTFRRTRSPGGKPDVRARGIGRLGDAVARRILFNSPGKFASRTTRAGRLMRGDVRIAALYSPTGVYLDCVRAVVVAPASLAERAS